MSETTVTNDSKNKIQTIKAVRAIYGIGLKEAKELVDQIHAEAIILGVKNEARTKLRNAVLDARQAGFTYHQILDIVGYCW
jgi:ribosomal protein L7/L12